MAIKSIILLAIFIVTLLQLNASSAAQDDPSGTTPMTTSTPSTHHHHHTKHDLQMQSLHGWMTWVGMGLLIPLGIIVARMIRLDLENGASSKRTGYWVNMHMIIQILAIAFTTIGAGVGFKFFKHSYNYTHQRLGLALYLGVWIVGVLGFLRARRGDYLRPIWYFMHWIIGTGTMVLGFLDLYIGIYIYEKHIKKSLQPFIVAMSTSIALMSFVYILQDRYKYMMQQGLVHEKSDNKVKGDEVHAGA